MMNVESKTSVWWDINSCPVPDGYDACRVRQCIESALEKLGYSGPLTINVVGNLKHTPDHVLGALSSSGIVVKHDPCGGTDFVVHLYKWTRVNPPPAKIMFISDFNGVEILSRTLSPLQAKGYNILLAYEDTPKEALDLVTCAEWLWKSLLKGEMDSGETRRPLQEKCSETGHESACFVCLLCSNYTSRDYFTCQFLEDFTTHLKGREHELREFKFYARDLSMDKEYLEMTAATTADRKKLSKITLKNKVVKAGSHSSHLMDATTMVKKISKRKNKLKKRRRRTWTK